MGNVHMEATQINYRGGASKMNVEDAIKSAIELTPEQKTNINKIPTIEAAVSTKTDQTVIAPEFDAESGIYAIGDLVMHEGKLYEFTSAHETAGDWNSEEVSEKTVADEIGDVKSGLTNLNYHKIAESASTGTYAAKLQSLATAYNSLSLAQKLTTVLILNGTDLFYPINASGRFNTTDVSANVTDHISVSLAGTFYVSSNGTINDASATENASVFSIWVAN